MPQQSVFVVHVDNGLGGGHLTLNRVSGNAGAAVSGHWSAGWDREGRGGQLDSGQRTRHCFASLPSLAVQ